MAVGRHRAEAGQAGNEDRRNAAGRSGPRRRSAGPDRRQAPPSAPAGTRRAAARAGQAAQRPRRDPDLALWGIFLGVVTYAASTRTEIEPAAGAGTAFLVTVVFAAIWWFGGRERTTGAPPAAAAPTEADGAVPAAAEPSAAPVSTGTAGSAADARTVSGSRRREAAAARPPVPQHPGAPVEPLPWDAAATRRGRRRADPGHAPADGPSRWTRAFGPPETGSLPLQQYVPTGPLPIIVADPEALDGRQRSHSST